jgi:hypothetical protein
VKEWDGSECKCGGGKEGENCSDVVVEEKCEENEKL